MTALPNHRFARADNTSLLPGVEKMRRRKQQSVGVEVGGAGREREVRREIENFLRALSSYPDRFARDPYLSFEQHLFSIAAANVAAGEGRHRD
jgi:hypothetical protein